jgi:hypothetical protein
MCAMVETALRRRARERSNRGAEYSVTADGLRSLDGL